jgi:type IV secretory pathway VirB10-like protein
VAFSLTQAAKAAKISKSTLSVALQKGRLSAIHLPDGSYQIEPVELFRVFPPKADTTGAEPGVRAAVEPKANPAELEGPNAGPQRNRPDGSVELAVLRREVMMLRERLEDRERERQTTLETVEDLRKRLDAEQEERRNLQRQLMAPPAREKPQEGPPSSPAAVEPSRSSRSFLGRLWGR